MTSNTLRAPERAENVSTWDDSAEIVIIGGGIAGLSLSAFASVRGASTLLLEKAAALGGTAKKAVAGMWVPGNRFQREAGVPDSEASAINYIARVSRPIVYDPEAPNMGLPAWEYEAITTFVKNAAPAFDEFEEIGVGVLWDSEFPDYWGFLPEVETTVGRELYPKNPDGSQGDGKSMLLELEAIAAAKGARFAMNQHVVGTVVDETGRVVGVQVETPEGLRHIRGEKAVVFCSGGFTQNPEMRNAYLDGRIAGGCAALTNEGDFQLISRGMGIPLYQMDVAWLSPILLERIMRKDQDVMGAIAIPGDSLIIVNRDGKRVHNEKAPYHERSRAMQFWDSRTATYPNLLTFAVWDQRATDLFPGSFLGNFIPPAGSPLWDTIITGATLEELQQNLAARVASLGKEARGIAIADDFATNLAQTITRYNGFARNGVDEDFHRGETPIEPVFHGPRAADNDLPNPTMYPLSEEGPYYATILVSGALETKGGPRAGTAGEVIGADEQPIPGLYAIGNAAAAPSGNSYPAGGLTFAPFITTAWLAARKIIEGVDPA